MFGSLWGSKEQPKPAATPAPAPAAADTSADKCPVDHSTRAAWLAANPGRDSPFQPKAQAVEGFKEAASSTDQDSSSSAPAGPVPSGKRVRRLSEDRVISSIPRYAPFTTVASSSTQTSETPSGHSSSDASSEENKWVYPSEGQFFRAMLRKHQAGLYSDGSTPPNPADMQTIVPIHNAVNEKAWAEVLKWEAGQGGDKCGGIRLVSFKGRPKERTPKAWINVALG
jgi:cytochrome c heme-lyase